ncbi:MAG: tRNA lysidine(34) synthetase TilS [Ruminococcus sp.]|nr:tRNA lysidine(34) synthetase TilS [Ruminococcus sp.]
MKNKILSAINKYRMISNGDTVIVALSGGADSVCLLYSLVSLKEQFNLTIKAAHVNHLLRGEESQRDMNFVKDLCKELDIELFVKAIDVLYLSKTLKQSTELCGRNVRYEFFEELSIQHNAKIATAHTASDNLETLIYNISRGTSINGLKGIIPKRNNIIRPLIFVTRQEIEDFCKNNNLKFVTDSTNNTDEYTRNKIRHNVVPVLKDINNSVENSSTALSQDVIEVNEFLDNYAESVLKKAELKCQDSICYNISEITSQMLLIQRQCIFKILNNNSINNLTRTHINLCADILINGGEVDLNGEFKAVSSQNMFRIIKTNIKNNNLSKINLNIDKPIQFGEKEISVKIVECFDIKDKNILDYNVIEKNPVFRFRKSGDFITLPKRNVTKSLKKFLIEEKIPKENRDKLLVLANGSEILWIEGYGVSKAGLINKNSSKALKIAVIDKVK